MVIMEFFTRIALMGAGWVMWVLVACSVLSVTIIIDRLVYFSRMKGDFPEFVQKLTEKLSAGDSLAIIAAWCSGQKLLEAQVAAVGLQKASQSVRSAEEAMSALMIASRVRLDRGLTVLGTLGVNTVFVGLLGTVIGVIQAFHALATSKTAGPEVVMASVSEALVATAVGILVAVPAVVAYNLLMRAIRKKMASSETVARIILTHLESDTGGGV
jgi:biopolymer transport protein ExbB